MSLTTLAKRLVPRALYPSAILRRKAQRATNNTVVGGPFSGMRYLEYSIWGAYIPKLIGCYELEIHPFIERMVSLNPTQIVNIGGAEGYYSVGLLRRMPRGEITVFEQLESGRGAITELARLNGVADRLRVEGSCNQETLAAWIRRAVPENATGALISDVEGYEIELLDPERVLGLERLHMLVEVHDAIIPGCADRLAARFANTHVVERAVQSPRVIEDYPFRDVASQVFPSAVLRYALSEFRNPKTSWLWFSPR